MATIDVKIVLLYHRNPFIPISIGYFFPISLILSLLKG
jgi:hypothetical protein